jgi:hypothetical protein
MLGSAGATPSGAGGTPAGSGGGAGQAGGASGIGAAGGFGGTNGSSTGGHAGTAATSGAGSGGSDGIGGTAPGGSSGISTDPNLKVALIADTDTGINYRDVLALVKNEQADALLVHGDMSYTDDPDAWWSVTESVLGTSFPVFIARGNHDDYPWPRYLAKARQHLGGATRVAGAHDANYKTIWRGLVIATIRSGDPATNLATFLKDEAHMWKICQWHENQEAMQVGGKFDEMGWEVYETCRRFGAIVHTGHEHSYSRTRTLIDLEAQIVDPSCSSATELCVSPGRTFVNVVGVGGHSIRSQLRCLPSTPPYGCKGEWAFIYTATQSATFGAQFLVFNAGHPRRAFGYFKNVQGQVVDAFTINNSP